MFVAILICLFCCLYYLYFRRKRKQLYEFSKSIPSVGNLPVVGHSHWFIGGPEKILKNIQTLALMIEDSGGISSIWLGPTLYVVTMNPEDVQKILENSLQKDFSYKFLQEWLGNGLFVAPALYVPNSVKEYNNNFVNMLLGTNMKSLTLSDPQSGKHLLLVDLWKVHRRLLLPVFHNRIIEDYIDVFGEQGSVLVKRMGERVGKSEFDVFPYITSCMLDIVFETAMGEKMDVQHNPDTPYLRARNIVISIIGMRFFKAWMQPDALFKLTSYSKLQKENIDLTHKFTDEVVKKKRALFEKQEYNFKEGRQDLLELLLNREMKFTDEQLREHIDSITIAGNDTTALVISYTLQLLGSHAEVQEKVYQELQNIFGDSDRTPTKEDMNKMELLERVIKETMRLYTVVPIIGRMTQKELKLSNCTVPAGVSCAILPSMMHRSKKIWGPDVDSFNPDRFLPQNNSHRHPCAYIPFSHGARNCIGRHFGMLSMKSILTNILRIYKIESKTCDRLKIEILLFPVFGHPITIKRRS